MKIFKNTGKSIVFLFLSSLLIFLYALTAEAGPGISDIQEKIQKIENDIKFEKDWEKVLEKAKTTINKFKDELTAEGFSNWFKVEAKLAIINMKLAPYFTLDNKGGLHWGPALQFSSMTMAVGMLPPQFAVGLPESSPLTPDDAVAALSEWQQKNRKKMEDNKRELEILESELKGLQKDEAGTLTDSQKKARLEFDALTALLNEHVRSISELEKIKPEYAKTEREMRLYIAAIEQAENKVESGNEIVVAINATVLKATGRLDDGSPPVERLKEKTAKLNKAYKTYAKASMAASEAADRLCSYAADASSGPPPSANKVRRWEDDSKRTIKEVASLVEGADEEVRSLVESMDSEISILKKE